MRLNESDIKIKCSESHLKTLLEYLSEMVEHHEDYFKTFIHNSTMRRIYRFHLNGLREKIVKLLFRSAGTQKINFTLSMSHAERITLFDVSANYPLPLEINFLEYEIKNKLLM